MEDSKSVPISLKIVAILFILGGISAAIEVIYLLINDHLEINFAVLGLFIGPGLLRLSRGWRKCALVLLWIALIALPFVPIIIITQPGPLDLTVFGKKAGFVSKEIGLLVAAFVFVLTMWQYRVLTRPDVRKLFGLIDG